MLRPPLCSTLFPYTTLFRSVHFLVHADLEEVGVQHVAVERVLLEGLEEDRLLALAVDVELDDGVELVRGGDGHPAQADRKSTRLNSSHSQISYAVFCLKKKK